MISLFFPFLFSPAWEFMSNELMTLEHCGFVYNFWFTCKKGSVKVNRTKQKQKNGNTLQ